MAASKENRYPRIFIVPLPLLSLCFNLIKELLVHNLKGNLFKLQRLPGRSQDGNEEEIEVEGAAQ